MHFQTVEELHMENTFGFADRYHVVLDLRSANIQCLAEMVCAVSCAFIGLVPTKAGSWQMEMIILSEFKKF